MPGDANGVFRSNGDRTFNGSFTLPSGVRDLHGTFTRDVPAFNVDEATLVFNEESDLHGKYAIAAEAVVSPNGLSCTFRNNNGKEFLIEGYHEPHLDKPYPISGFLEWA